MDTAQWPQGVGVVQLPNMEVNNSEAAVVDHQRSNNNNNIHSKPIAAPRPQKPQAINCPRCNSTHTKFCYYNNYSLSQPRYFCKTCRRYWTEGGSLRNVPVGGGSRKNKRSSSSSTSSLASKKLPESINITSHQNPNNISIFHHEGQDLNLAYPPIRNPSSTYGIPDQFVEFPNSNSSTQNNFSQLLKSAGISGGSRSGLGSFMSMIPISDPNGTGLLYSSSTSGSGFPYQDYSKTSGLNFSLNHHDQGGFDDSAGNHTGGYESSLQGVHRENMSSANNHPKLFNFPFEDLKQPADHHGVTTTRTSGHELMDQNEETRRQGDDHLQSSGLIWSNGGLGGGASW